MAIDVCAAGLRERPGPWLDGDLDRINRGDLNHVKLHQWTGSRTEFAPAERHILGAQVPKFPDTY
jgi:hypothetical protein